MKDKDDFDGTQTVPVQAMCKVGNLWDLPTSLPDCVTSK